MSESKSLFHYSLHSVYTWCSLLCGYVKDMVTFSDTHFIEPDSSVELHTLSNVLLVKYSHILRTHHISSYSSIGLGENMGTSTRAKTGIN